MCNNLLYVQVGGFERTEQITLQICFFTNSKHRGITITLAPLCWGHEQSAYCQLTQCLWIIPPSGMWRRVVRSVLKFCRNRCYHLQGRKDSFETFDKFLAGVVTRIRDGRSGVRIPARQEVYLCSQTSSPTLLPTQPHIHWMPGALSPGRRR